MRAPTRKGSLTDRYTAHLHLRAAFAGGMTAGILLLNEVIARKQLGASRLHVLALLLLPACAQFLAVAWNPADPRRPLGKYPFRGLGIPSRLLLLSLLLVPWVREPSSFVVIVALGAMTEALLLPIQNVVLARNYAEGSRGHWFGWAAAAQALAIALVTVPAGLVLDASPESWPLLYAIAALAGTFAYLQWSRLRRRKRARLPPSGIESVRSPWRVLLSDRGFLAYEACVMVYGIGFMMLQPVLPLYLVDEMNASYTEVSVARGLLFYVAILVSGPYLGRMGDRFGVLWIGAWSFLALAGFPLMLIFLPGTKGLFAAYVLYGLAMGGVQVAWNLGPIVIARRRDPLPYLNAHVALVGVRALIGMTSGTWLQSHASSAAVFWCVVGFELLAAAGMALTARAHSRSVAAGTA